ncbi:hypothetical protein C0992_001814 [Termitomyces sp. T32_za158]|nr:hypothetical protein C0992_001814 [Termitomyces sp. T32_za158]
MDEHRPRLPRHPPPKPHSHLPPVVPAVLPRVRRQDFDPYLRAIDHDWSHFQLSSAQRQTPPPNSPLHSVPDVFFSHSFSLDDPRTFSAVTADADPTSLADSLPLLEKFSHYADTVEQHLVLEISHRAPSFFAALTNLHDLHAESEHCLERIASLRRLLTDLDNNSAKKGLDLVRRQARVANIAVAADAVKQVASVVEMGRLARALVSAAQWTNALAVIDEMDAMRNQQNLPLSSLRAYAALPQHLRDLSAEIAAALSSEFVAVLQDHLSKDDDAQLRDRLRPVIQGLVRTRAVKEGLLAWREVVLGLIRQIASRTNIRDMPHAEFVLVLQTLYADLLKCIQGIQSQTPVILDILAATPNPPPSSSAQDELDDILATTAELANTQLASLIAQRHDHDHDHTALSLSDFLAFFNAAWSFVVTSEVISRRMIVGLRGVLVGHAKSFLQAFHQKRIAGSAKLVEDEQWKPVDIGVGVQRVADAIVCSAVQDAPELVLAASASTPSNTPPASKPAKQLRVEDRAYFAVGATTEVLVLLLDYLRVVVNLPMLTTDVMSRVVEFLKAFNSRTCQVVLGAGAMRSAGLKNITAKHLALASQSLSIMFEMIPYVRETFRRHLSPKQAVILVEFDKLKRDYQEHQNEIHSKLVAIMGDRLSAHIRSLQGVDWTVPKPGGGINDYVEILVKETVTLHRVLSRYLTVSVVEVFAAINHGLSEEYNKIELPSQEAKTRLLADAKYLHQQLSALKNVGPPSGMLVTVVSEKSIPRTGPPSPGPGPSLASASTAASNAASTSAPTTTTPPTRSNTLSSANQRLKGLLSGKSPPTTPVRSSSLASLGSPSPPQPVRKMSAGFKQVEEGGGGGGGGSDTGPGGQGDALKGEMQLRGTVDLGVRDGVSPPGPVGPDSETEPDVQGTRGEAAAAAAAGAAVGGGGKVEPGVDGSGVSAVLGMDLALGVPVSERLPETAQL